MSNNMGFAKDNLREYNRVHKWISRHYVKSGVCEFCNLVCKTQWSNKSYRYVTERDDWQELCHKCHHIYDLKVLNKKVGAPKKNNYTFLSIKDMKKEFEGYKWGTKEELYNRLKTYTWFNSK